MLSVKLVVVGGEAKDKEVQLKLPTVIGRGRGKDGVTLTLPHKLVSRKHTELFEQDGRLYVKDLGSLNGTYVNNQRIVQRTALEPNELLTLGDVTFRAVYDVAGVQAAPEVPEFQEVQDVSSSSEDVLNEEAKTDSDTNKSMVDINPGDITDEVDAALEAVLDAPVASQPTADQEETQADTSPKPEEREKNQIQSEDSPKPKSPVGREKAPEPSVSAAAQSPSGSSDIFSEPLIQGGRPDKSICFNALDGLPSEQKNSEFEVQLNGVERPDSVKQVEIDLDAPVAAEAPEDSRLGSFLKKMPR